MKYRREIDGLRALAVIPVILFHAGFTAFGGGYVGVDVFFVISGYLITSIILADKEAGKFSLRGFYERRARRILPALFLVMLVCVPLAVVLMLPDDLENFGQSLFATTLFSNNILLWVTSGYWNLANEFKPLLHMWSLGVEEQYYFVFPLLVMLTWRMGKRWMSWLFLFLAIVSVIAAQLLSSRMPEASFYLLPTRLWELLIGVLVAIHLPSKSNAPASFVAAELLSAIGLLLIVAAVVTFGTTTVHPGLYTLLPVLGTTLIIIFATDQTRVGRFLGSKPLVGIGLVSYSAYLWHQPAFAFLRLASLEQPGTVAMVAAILVSFLLATLSWRFVERPFRHGKTVKDGPFLVAALVVGGVLAATGLVIYVNSGFVYLWSELNTDMRGAGRRLNAEYNMAPFRYANVDFSDDGGRRVLILGNSFARDVINSGLENGYFSNSQISYSSAILECVPDEAALEPGLRARIAAADYLIFGTPAMDLSCWGRNLAMYRRMGARKIIVVGTKNFGWNLNAVMRLDPSIRYQYRARVLPDVWAANERYAHAIAPENFVNLLELLADREGRVRVFTDERKFISQDREHLTRDGAKFVGRILFQHPLLQELR